MRVLVLIVVVTWESKANSSSTCTELKTGTELGKNNLEVDLNIDMIYNMIYGMVCYMICDLIYNMIYDMI